MESAFGVDHGDISKGAIGNFASRVVQRARGFKPIKLQDGATRTPSVAKKPLGPENKPPQPLKLQDGATPAPSVADKPLGPQTQAQARALPKAKNALPNLDLNPGPSQRSTGVTGSFNRNASKAGKWASENQGKAAAIGAGSAAGVGGSGYLAGRKRR